MHSHARALQRLLLILGPILLMASCDARIPGPEPSPPQVSGTAVTGGQNTPAPSTAPPTATAEPTPSSTHTATAPPPASPTPPATQSPAPTLTPTSTPTLEPPAPSPAPQPGIRLEAAQRHKRNGDYGQAIDSYLALLSDAPSPDQARLAHFDLAESYLFNRDFPEATAAWQDYIATYPEDDLLPQALLMAARALDGAGDCAQAIPLYDAYLTHETLLADIVYAWIGDCHALIGSHQEAIAVYQKALGAASDQEAQTDLREKIAGAHLALNDVDAALAEYDAILDVARKGAYRAQIEHQAGQALAGAGRQDAAYERYQRAVHAYPKTEHAYLSLLELLGAGVGVDDFQQGIVSYHAGSDQDGAYVAAITSFDRYLAGEAPEKTADALYHKALALRALDLFDDALGTLEAIITGYAQSPRRADAWLEKAATLAEMGEDDRAVQTYQDLAASTPDAELARQALWRAAKVREGAASFAEAARLFQTVHDDFPSHEDADEALWKAGLSLYRAGTPDAARATWQSFLEEYPKSRYRTRIQYWLGKLEAARGADTGGSYWDQLTANKPRNYYSLRVRQIREGESLTSTRLTTAAIEPPPWDATQAAEEIAAWMGGWAGAHTATSLLTLPASVTADPSFRRGNALLSVGLRPEALDAFEDVFSSAWNKPLLLARLALHFREAGWHGLAARSALRLVGHWPYGSVPDAPLAVQRLAYPLVYADLLSTEALARNLDPLLLAALIRQESLFEPAAESYAGARGLGQVMPATGKGIAHALKMENFVLDDLYRPSVSVRFGAFYLGVQMERFDDQLLIALAAYNGGPGNTLRWLEGTGDDLDMFVELITSPASRAYLQHVFGHYIHYETLYRPREAGE
jgi:soluble lytic murein transglycosylase